MTLLGRSGPSVLDVWNATRNALRTCGCKGFILIKRRSPDLLQCIALSLPFGREPLQLDHTNDSRSAANNVLLPPRTRTRL